MNDLKFALRQLLKNPGFAAVAVLTLALGIGANTAIFSMFKAVALRPLGAVRNPQELVTVTMLTPDDRKVTFSYPDYRDFRDGNGVFADLAASCAAPLSLSANENAERIWGEFVSGDYFQVLGVGTTLGRLLGPDDDRVAGGHPVAVISHALWQRRFGGTADIVGKTILLNSQPFTVVGVTAREFRGSVVGMALDLFVPVMMVDQLKPFAGMTGDLLTEGGAQWLVPQGRLRRGIPLQQANAAVQVLAKSLATRNPDGNRDWRMLVLPLWKSPFGGQGFLLPLFSGLMVVTGIVLLIGCANVASMLIARAVRRQREMAIRLALGAGRRRLTRQLLTESLLLAMLGGLAGLPVGFGIKDFLTGINPPTPFPLRLDASFDPLVLGFTGLVALFSAVAFGLAPALQATRPALANALRADTQAAGRRRSWLRHSLVAGQVALSLPLLIASGLIVRSLLNAQRLDPGFDAKNLLLVSLDLNLGGYDETRGQVFFREAVERIQALPGVQSVSLARMLPLSVLGGVSSSVNIEGYQPQTAEQTIFHLNFVGPGYFRNLRLPVREGREFGPQDNQTATPVVIINERMARRFWPGQSALGKRIETQGRWWEVIGVVRDLKYVSLTESPQPYFYLAHAQTYQPEMTMHIRTTSEVSTIQPAVRAELRALDGNLPMVKVWTMTEHLVFSRSLHDLAAKCLSASGAVALLLAATGLFGLVNYLVNQRTREIGVRIALGATANDLLKLVLRQGTNLVFIGGAIGLLASFGLTRALSGLLVGVQATDLFTFLAASALLLGVALLACWLPARRATRIDPMEALRCE